MDEPVITGRLVNTLHCALGYVRMDGAWWGTRRGCWPCSVAPALLKGAPVPSWMPPRRKLPERIDVGSRTALRP